MPGAPGPAIPSTAQPWQPVCVHAAKSAWTVASCVVVATDPITKQPFYSGAHTSRTARIKPITPAGQICTSSAFATVATALGVTALRFSYIGHTRLAKHYGVLPLYHMKRQHRDPRRPDR